MGALKRFLFRKYYPIQLTGVIFLILFSFTSCMEDEEKKLRSILQGRWEIIDSELLNRFQTTSTILPSSGEFNFPVTKPATGMTGSVEINNEDVTKLVYSIGGTSLNLSTWDDEYLYQIIHSWSIEELDSENLIISDGGYYVNTKPEISIADIRIFCKRIIDQ